jgi:hypothetical protein
MDLMDVGQYQHKWDAVDLQGVKVALQDVVQQIVVHVDLKVFLDSVVDRLVAVHYVAQQEFVNALTVALLKFGQIAVIHVDLKDAAVAVVI